MKQIILVIGAVFVLGASTSFGQRLVVPNDPGHDDKPVHFGFCLGLNVMDYYVRPAFNDKGEPIAELTDLQPGFNVQVVSNFRLSNNVDFRFLPGLVLGDRTINIYSGSYFNADTGMVVEFNNDTVFTSSNSSAYLDFPMLFKFKTNRINNYRPFLIVGLNPRYDLSTSIKGKEEGFQKYEKEQKFELQKLVPFWEVGAGIDFYLPYFKLGVELKYSRSFADTMYRPTENASPFVSQIEVLQSSVFLISFYFE
jgi:hypothetical protein